MKVNKNECCTTCRNDEKKCKDSRNTTQFKMQVIALHNAGKNTEEIVYTMYKLLRNPPYAIHDNPQYTPRYNALCKLVERIVEGEV